MRLVFLHLFLFCSLVACTDKFSEPHPSSGQNSTLDVFEVYDEEITAGVIINNIPLNQVAKEYEIFEDQEIIVNGLLVNDQGLDISTLTILRIAQPSAGTVEKVGATSLRYTPLADFNGIELLKYIVSDGGGGEYIGYVVINVKPVNDVPFAKPDTFTVKQSQDNLIDLVLNDAGLGDNVEISILSLPDNGQIKILDNVVSYTPNGDYFGQDMFVYQLIDSDGEMAAATVQLTIECFVNCSQVFSLFWDPSVSTDVTRYRVYMGEQAGQLTNAFDVFGQMTFDYTAVKKGEYYFAVSAINANGVESELSPMVMGVF